MTHTLMNLPFEKDMLAPYMSAETLDFHHGKHHATYVEKLNGMIAGTEFENMNLEEIVRTSSGAVFNNAAQIWNHDFFWNCLSPARESNLSEELEQELNNNFGSLEEFKQLFTLSAIGNFGSGWTWLVKNTQGKLEIINTDDAQTALTLDVTPLLVLDIWEHAYYIDYRNARPSYIENFWNIVSWSAVSGRLA